MKIKIDSDFAAELVVKSLKQDYKFCLDDTFAVPELEKAIEVMLRYYMVANDADAWIAKQKAKRKG